MPFANERIFHSLIPFVARAFHLGGIKHAVSRQVPPRAMSRGPGQNRVSGDVAVIQEVRGLAEELTNLRQENTILQGNFDEVRKTFWPASEGRHHPVRCCVHCHLTSYLLPLTSKRLPLTPPAQLKTHHTKIQTAYDALASQYHDLSSEKSELESYYDGQIEQWRADLEQKQAEFEEARGQIMQPRELDMLRKKLMEEIEIPTRQKLHAYEQEIEDGSEKYTQAVRDLETLRTIHDVEVAKLLKDSEYQKMDYSSEINMLKKELALCEEALAMKTRENESFAACANDLVNVKARCESLSGETEFVARQRDAAVSVTDGLNAKLKLHVSITEKLERRIHVLQGEVEFRDAEIARVKDLVVGAETEKQELTRRLDESDFKHRADIKLCETRAAKARAELEHEFAIERDEAEEKEGAILSRLATHDASIKKIQDECDAKVYRAEDGARDARRFAEAGKIDAEIKLDAALTEFAVCKSDMLRAIGEAEGLRAALAVMEREYANEVPAMRSDLAQHKKDVEHERVRIADLKQTIERERVERVEVGASLIDRDREVRRLLAELERKDLKTQNDVCVMKKAWQKEKLGLIARAKDIACTMEERHRLSMRKARRKIESAQRKVAALANDKVSLLESTVPKSGCDDAERNEATAGGTSASFERELALLRGRQDTYDRSVANASADE